MSMYRVSPERAIDRGHVLQEWATNVLKDKQHSDANKLLAISIYELTSWVLIQEGVFRDNSIAAYCDPEAPFTFAEKKLEAEDDEF